MTRRTEEELGILPGSVRIAGLLDDLVTPTGFAITPVVGVLERIPPLAPNAAEEYDVWFYHSNGHLVWEVTAAIIRMLLRTISGFSRPGQTPAA